MIPKDKLMRTPEAVFVSPSDVVENMELSREQKIAVLRQWKDETVTRGAAEEEGLQGGTDDAELLQQITDALIAIGEH